jgi:hypothetical protein
MRYDISLTRVVAATELAIGEVVAIADFPVRKIDPAGLVQATASSDASRSVPARPRVATVVTSAVTEESNRVAIVSVVIGTSGDTSSAVSTTVDIQGSIGRIEIAVIELTIDAAGHPITRGRKELACLDISLRKSLRVRPDKEVVLVNLRMGCFASCVVGNNVSALRSVPGDEKATRWVGDCSSLSGDCKSSYHKGDLIEMHLDG